MMFRKLYKNLLVLNISILSLLLLVIFSSLYISTYSDIHNRTSNELENIIKIHLENNPPPDSPDGFRPERTVSFVVILDNTGEVEEVISQFDITDTTIDEILGDVTRDQGDIKFDDETWSYKKQETVNGEIIAFTNTTNEQDLLNTTLIRFIIIFAASVGITAIISSLLTKKSITPVKESFEKQKQFVSDASHELKTPLTVINTNVDILISEDKTDNKWLKYIKSEVTRMTKLTHDLLYLANTSEIKKQDIVKSKINISERTESIILGIEALAYEKNISLDYKIEPNVDIEFNTEQFHQLLMILLDNAIKYTDKDGSININLKAHNNNCYIFVRNTGKGIPHSDLEHIFDRFYKTDKSRENTSNSFGLGLSIANAICVNNGCKLSVVSEENEYTQFTIKIKTI
ncbi:HAMP domain-containing histidine kinase [Candidatus Izimaplasma bacterium]|nr:HAMP domain-containing histidine kinase [Candidatus Izimaplasma bacterium]